MRREQPISPLKVLFIEDDPLVREIMCGLLRGRFPRRNRRGDRRGRNPAHHTGVRSSLNPEDCRLGPLVKAIIKPVDPADLDKLIEGLCG
jgi:hypothetical protein